MPVRSTPRSRKGRRSSSALDHASADTEAFLAAIVVFEATVGLLRRVVAPVIPNGISRVRFSSYTPNSSYGGGRGGCGFEFRRSPLITGVANPVIYAWRDWPLWPIAGLVGKRRIDTCLCRTWCRSRASWVRPCEPGSLCRSCPRGRIGKEPGYPSSLGAGLLWRSPIRRSAFDSNWSASRRSSFTGASLPHAGPVGAVLRPIPAEGEFDSLARYQVASPSGGVYVSVHVQGRAAEAVEAHNLLGQPTGWFKSTPLPPPTPSDSSEGAPGNFGDVVIMGALLPCKQTVGVRFPASPRFRLRPNNAADRLFVATFGLAASF